MAPFQRALLLVASATGRLVEVTMAIQEHNQLYGTIPSWGRNSTLRQLNLGHNQLTGSIPADWASNNIMQVLNLEV